jgi:hypothetical protein
MWGNATLAMEVSITSINVASITEIAIGHGFAPSFIGSLPARQVPRARRVRLQGWPMFEQSFTLTVPTDAEGRFRSTQEISSPFSLDVKISATLQSPEGIRIHASFSLAPKTGGDAAPFTFSLGSGETADLGKWKAIAGDDANLASAEGHTEPAAPDSEITVLFVAAPSFF